MRFSRIKKVLFAIVLIGLIWGTRYAWTSLPVITGYAAKIACSSICVSGRALPGIESQELGSFPLNLARVSWHPEDSSVSASVFGMATQKAIYRHGLGCTLINDLTEEQIRNQHFNLAPLPGVNQDTIPWPDGDLLPADLPAGIDSIGLHRAVQYAFAEQDAKRPWRTRAVVVVYDGKLVAEQYAPGFDRHTPLLSWSMAKTITGTLTGILVKEGKLNVHAKAPVPEWQNQNDGRGQITLEEILQQTTGLDFDEDYTKASSATNMLFRRGDMGAFTAGLPLREKPGSRFYYSSGNSNILSRIIRHTLGDSAYHAFPAKALFYKIGMLSAVLEPDASGTFVGSSYAYANARDWARLGLLYAQNGSWQGTQILSPEWVSAATRPSKVAPQGEYGYQIWLNAGAPGNASNRKFPSLPPDLYYADGYEGQSVFVIPSRKLVVVRLGQTAGNWFDVPGFLTGILSSLPN